MAKFKEFYLSNSLNEGKITNKGVETYKQSNVDWHVLKDGVQVGTVEKQKGGGYNACPYINGVKDEGHLLKSFKEAVNWVIKFGEPNPNRKNIDYSKLPNSLSKTSSK